MIFYGNPKIKDALGDRIVDFRINHAGHFQATGTYPQHLTSTAVIALILTEMALLTSWMQVLL